MREQDFRPRYMQQTPSEDGSDLISREAAVDTILETNARLKEQTTINHLIESIDALPSAEPSDIAKPCENLAKDCKTDLLSRAYVLNVVQNADDGNIPYAIIKDIIQGLPSVSADSDDLIIKNGKGIQDGLYNIKDGEIFKYKAKGGTVRVYKLVERVSAERVGEWIFKTNIICGNGREGAGYVCSVCGVDFFHVDGMKYCPNCGAKMKGGAE